MKLDPEFPTGLRPTRAGRERADIRDELRQESVPFSCEERIIATLEQAELKDANVRGVGAQIEFKREGHAEVTISISRELVERARALHLTTGELLAEAIRLAMPGRFNLVRPVPPRGH